MPTTISLSPAQIERFRRDAKKVSRANQFTYSQALDHIAGEHGYSNWSLLIKHNPYRSASDAASPPHLLRRSMEDMRQVMRKSADSEIRRYSTRSDLAAAVTQDIHQNFVSAINAVNFAVEYMETLLEVPRFSIHIHSQASSEMRFWLPYCVHNIGSTDAQILTNREYKPVGHITDKRVPYEKFCNLHLGLSSAQLKAITAPASSEGYLYNDGCNPWWSRNNASNYLERLFRLQAIVSS